MEDFNIINQEGKRLLEEVDTSMLASFFDDYKKQIIENEEFQTSEEIRQYFQNLITKTIAPEELKQRAIGQIDGFLGGYSVLDTILSKWPPNLREERSYMYDTLGIPFDDMSLHSSLSKIYTNLLLQSPGIPGLFLSKDNTEEKNIRILQAYIADKFHPLGMNTDTNGYQSDYVWTNKNNTYIVGQNIHGDVHFSKHQKAPDRIQQELFSETSTVMVKGEGFEGLHIYQYTNSLVSLICLYALRTGYIPPELENWKKTLATIRPRIPNATVHDDMEDDPEHIAIMAGWKYEQNLTSTDGVYRFIGTNIHSYPGSEGVITSTFRGNSLVFIKESEHGEIEFPFPNNGKIVRFRKVFELEREDIGEILLALFHLPGRSLAENIKTLSAFDWARKNGYMSAQVIS